MSNGNADEGLEYAGFWIRLWASIIDSILVAVIVTPIVTAIYGEYSSPGLGATDDPTQLFTSLLTNPFRGPLDVLISGVLPAIAIIVFWIYKSATPGKMIVGAKIVDARTGRHPSTGQLIGRYLGYYVSIFTLMLGFLWIAFDPRKQGFHDKLAGTVVVKTARRKPAADFENRKVNQG